jgi:hypothetical protein
MAKIPGANLLQHPIKSMQHPLQAMQQSGLPQPSMNPMQALQNAQRTIPGMGGAPTINALQPPGPTTMQPPGGNNFMAQRLAQTGQNPAEAPTAIRRPMPDQPMMRPPMALPQNPNAPSGPPTGFGNFRSRIRT